jgi:primosomal protein N' (replication factor Y)
MTIAQVALDLPLHTLFDYRLADGAQARPGLRVRVPFGRQEKIGVIVTLGQTSAVAAHDLRMALEILEDLPALPADFFHLCAFASRYYQAPLGEIILQALPPGLRKTRPVKRRAAASRSEKLPAPLPAPSLTDEQARALALMRARQGFQPFLLHGVTGSGKTEIYLQRIKDMLGQGRQVLLLVPEINLTPQLEARIRERFPHVPTVMLHSELGEAARERAWRAAFLGEARIVVGTRLAVFTPLPDLGLILLDEEHDPSFKQQDGCRYSARDLAIFRAQACDLPIVLGSATPSLESWAHARSGRYTLISLKTRAVHAARLPDIRLLDTRRMKLDEGLSPPLVEALRARLAAGEQSLVFLNRRGFAPVLACVACGWVARCRRCAANMVVHMQDKRMRCHHCGLETPIPRACPTCGNQDIHPFGRGTQRLEAALVRHFPEAEILRVDRDSVKSRRQWEILLARIHRGEAKILVGTQMLAKGHDFPRLTLVGVVGADAALFAADCRAPERLFAQLMQVAGRAGRAGLPGEVILQTETPEHPLYHALTRHDYPGFADLLLAERRAAGFPPFVFQAMLRAEAPHMEDALAFLKSAIAQARLACYPNVTLYDPVPMRLSRLWNLERAQLLAESPSRKELQAFLAAWRAGIETIKSPARLRWHLEVDPLEF